MRITIATLILVVLALAPSARAAAGPQHVKAQLLADVKQIVPGKPFHLGVLLTIDPGWHIYWLNPGDSGLATKITLQLPKGFTAGEVQFPTPIEIVDPGNIKVYGYTNEVMFIATVTPDAKLAAGNADLSAKVNYLVCKDDCIPGRASPELKVPIATAGGHSGNANKEMFINWIAQMPEELKAGDYTLKFKPADHSVQLDVGLPVNMDKNEKLAQVFPFPNDDVKVDVDVEPGDSDLGIENVPITLTVTPLAGRAMPATKLPIVVGYENSDRQHRGVLVEIDLSKLKGNSPDQPAKH